MAGIGRYGPWLRHGETYTAIPEDDDVLTVGINRAVMLIAEKDVRESRARGPKRVLHELGPHPADGAPVWLKTGHYGPFVGHRRRYASLPKRNRAGGPEPGAGARSPGPAETMRREGGMRDGAGARALAPAKAAPRSRGST